MRFWSQGKRELVRTEVPWDSIEQTNVDEISKLS